MRGCLGIAALALALAACGDGGQSSGSEGGPPPWYDGAAPAAAAAQVGGPGSPCRLPVASA